MNEQDNYKLATILTELAINGLSDFEFIGITPAGGKAYYSSDLDVAVYRYRDHIKVYYDRHILHGKTASSFSKSIINKINC